MSQMWCTSTEVKHNVAIESPPGGFSALNGSEASFFYVAEQKKTGGKKIRNNSEPQFEFPQTPLQTF